MRTRWQNQVEWDSTAPLDMQIRGHKSFIVMETARNNIFIYISFLLNLFSQITIL